MSQMPECPECDKMAELHNESFIIGQFLDWLMEKHVILAVWDEWDDLQPSVYRGAFGTEKLIAEYLDIDLDKVEEERAALLAWIREENKKETDVE